MYIGIHAGTSHEEALCPLFPDQDLDLLVFCGGRKTGQPGEKLSEQGKNQQQTQPTCDASSDRVQPMPHW